MTEVYTFSVNLCISTSSPSTCAVSETALAGRDFPERPASLHTMTNNAAKDGPGHAPLNKHLFKLGKVDSELCPYCKHTPESVKHFLIDCQELEEQRAQLKRLDSRRSQELQHLLGNEKFINETLGFVEGTGRFRESHGTSEVE